MPTLHRNTRMCVYHFFSRRFSSISSPLPAAATATDFQMLKCVLDDCKTSSDSKAVLETHAKIVKLGFGMDYSLVSHLLLTYINCGKLDFARHLLDETPCWKVDLITGNIMISRFMKNGDVEAAKRVFFNMPLKDVVSWNSLIGGCVKNSRLEEALRMFKDMCLLGIEPDEFTFSSVIAGCARLGALDHALWIHNLLIEKKIALNDILLSAIIDMYAKCGKIEIAKEFFDGCRSSSVSVWNSMITGLAVHGLATDAISVFFRLEEEKIYPDSITFLGILVACSHCGLVELGKKYFDMMNRKFSIEPELEHYGTMVDILGRAGQLDEAYATIRAMPMQPDVVIWKALLSACRTYRNAPLGEIAIRNISSLDGGDYVMLSNTYCSLNKWSSSANMREEMKREGIHKDHGKSWIELAGIIHQFKARNQAHPEMEAIYKIMKQLIKRAKLGGYVPATDLVLMDVSEEEKEENLIFHSEKLALAFGVLKTSLRTEIRITKNLRTCYDCHSWFKIVSRMLARVIIVRDRVRFHKFEAGSCSCGDYW
ncbi:pentatricopeptide repeat-containing protein At5g50990-like [Chenopodium quinoa]|uniref:pentatricopeptide repeat-containing protein At5g50990-like n=1 Tax=Chenopodium quinoa TaxID=63459 RepID=UPI000B7877FF|nr:pentatricopeptide repeat-containing protein At5g50990-like [Chenopodium quinoa]XP_021731821.1 pentatricopeptide repeat-containing protein At5g50990-like [Chenopodium quinoa]XP_021731828.1 pentatricopeptide repeat-containing protein At5g50990-like [Chenopodium quinoa]XP_021731840.1 pentatricopeptide repeat-containing protein At5g50990-like [Chenopodium quinoa]